ncbi:ArnT family glycosyltransferase [Thermogemmatispora sp.]|uniref:ArnT family glycosyltransferase n=1 Tax=Thermogemmatispora sp. TaxID=1968838 RepID=UPI0035E43FAD
MMGTPTPTPALPEIDRPLAPDATPTPSAKWEWPPLWRRLALAAIALLSVFLNFYQLGANGFGNLYYAAGVRSMLDSWHNFFFVSFDPGGFVTIDKPPLGFWLQVASAKIFGFTPFSVLLPQALAGVLSVLLLYHLVRRHFGTTAGLLAALALAISPISVVTNRNNTIDSTLVLVMLLGAWAVMRAAETGKLRWLLLCALCIGLGFNIKMLEAYLVVPAYGLLYLLAAPRRILVRIGHLALATVLMLAVSFSWALAVDLTPASARPYVGSSQDNSEISLALGYNGIQRLLGHFGFGPGARGNSNIPTFERNSSSSSGSSNSNSNSNSASSNGTNGASSGAAPAEGYFQPGEQPASGAGAPPGNGAPPTSGNQEGTPFVPGSGTSGSDNGSNSSSAASTPEATTGPGNGTLPGNTGQGPEGLRGAFSGNGGGGGMFGTGTPGPFRLFNEPLGGQIVWLLPLALLGIIAVAWQRRPRFRGDPEQQGLVLWGIWLLTTAVFFSVAGFFHQYYLTTMAPAVAALFGIGVVVMWHDYRRHGWRGWLLPLALLLTALEQLHIITSNPAWGTWLIPLIAVPCALAALVLFMARFLPFLRERARLLVPALVVALIALQLTPAVWSFIPVLRGEAASLPTAGPGNQFGGLGTGGFRAFSSGSNASENAARRFRSYIENFEGPVNGEGGQRAGGSEGLTVNTALINYLEAHRNGAKYLVAVMSSNEADSIILATNQPVMAMGGFSGSDPILTPAKLAALAESGQVRFFLINGTGGGPGGGQSALVSWITQHCKLVSSSAWQSSGASSGGFGGGGQLYEYTGS